VIDGPWEGATAPPHDVVFPAAVLRGSTLEAARALLGSVLASDVQGCPSAGVVVETEAYIGPGDPASHAAERIGQTDRNSTMFAEGGLAYVYRIYGLHDCVNVVTGPEGAGLAVLIRALRPLTGIPVMRRRRGRSTDLSNGPGKLSQALGITTTLDGHPLDSPPLRLLKGWSVPDDLVEVTGRVGISRAVDWPLRFFVSGDRAVSKGKVVRGRRSRDYLEALERMEIA